MSRQRPKRLLYGSPFPPMRSGISDYSEVLIYGLRKHFDITLLIDDYQLENRQLYRDFKVKVFDKDPLDFSSFDYHIYNIGNNPHFHGYIYECALKKPGLIILHDFVIYYLTVGYYQRKGGLYSQLYKLGGPNAIQLIKKYTKKGMDLLECKDLAPKLPLNMELIRSKNKLLVHSDYTYQRVSELVENQKQLRRINHVELIGDGNSYIEKDALYRRYHIPNDALLLCSFGSIDKTKLNHVVCQVVNELNKQFDNRLVYVMVGAGDYIDDYLNQSIRKTGYVDLLEFNSLIKHSDIVINLRHPSMGETSGAVIRALGLAKPCIVSDDAWFSELPEDVVVKVKNEKLPKFLCERLADLLENPTQRAEMACKAKEYIREEHAIEKVSGEIADFLG